MKRAAIFGTALSVVLACSLTWGQEDKPSAREHLKQMRWIIGEWTAEFKVPAGHPTYGPEGAKVVSNVSWRWMLNRDFIIINFKREVDGEMILGKEIIGWDPESEKLVHWLFWQGGSHGSGEWSLQGDTWHLQWSISGPDNKPLKGTSHIVKVDKDTFAWHATDVVEDGKRLPDWPVITYRRKVE